MGVARMKYLNVYGPEHRLQQTLSTVAHTGSFAPESGEAVHSAIRVGSNEYEPLLAKAKGLLKDLDESSLAADFIGPVDSYKLPAVAAYLEKFAAEVADRNRRKTEVETRLEMQVKAEDILSHMTDLDLSVEDMFKVETLKVRVGRLPKSSYARLEYYAEKGFNFTAYFNFIVYDFDGEYYWGLYFAPKDNAKDIDDIFNSLYFERVWVPEFVHGKPDEALKAIRDEEKRLREELKEVTTPHGITSQKELTTIQDMTAWLNTMNQLFEMRKYALVFNHTFYISGFVPEDEYASFRQQVEGIEAVHIKEAESEKMLPEKPPVKLKNNWFARPYQMFTEMYGLPAYTDIDPTGLVALIYSVLYGIMFADVGQGLVLGLIGYFIMYRRRHMAIGLILTRTAIFSVIFGFLFGSVFGFEHLLDPMWHALGFEEKPIEVLSASSVNLILLASVALGIGMVAVTIVISIASKLRRKEFGPALFGPNGIAGLVFYTGVVGLVLDMMLLHAGFASTPYILLLVILPLLLIYLQEPLGELVEGKGFHIHNPVDFFVSGFFELFVSILEYLSNTVSFLRVGGFVLVHAGMMSVVATLAGLGGGVSSVVVYLLGNVVVIALEGLLVGIQALRLNFYEVFSRFYGGGGAPFSPLRILSDTTEL